MVDWCSVGSRQSFFLSVGEEMARKTGDSQQDPVPVGEEQAYSVMLPCTPDHFRDFIGGLLGEPQVITKILPGEFEIKRENLLDLYHLVDQRVRQQNEATLVQFTVRIVFDDNSSTLINSVEDFEHYNEVRPISSVGAHLTWTFLVQFRDKQFPEKQIIEVSFVTSDVAKRIMVFEGGLAVPHGVFQFSSDFVSLRISHTARSWGADIEALLTGHIKVVLKTKNRYKEFAREHNGSIGLAVFALLFLSSVGGAFYTMHSFMSFQQQKVSALMASPAAKAGAMNEKIDYLMDLIASGAWPRYFFYVLVFIVVSLIISAIFAIWAGIAADVKEPSYILLTRQAEKRKEELERKNKRAWLNFTASIVSALFVGIIKQVILAAVLRTWPPAK